MIRIKNFSVGFLHAFLSVIIFIGPLSAQNSKRAESFRLDAQFGSRLIHRSIQPAGIDIDFMNYLGYGNEKYNGVMSFGLEFIPNENWTIKTGFSMLSDMLPNHLRVEVMRRVKNTSPGHDWGISTVLFAYPQYLNEFNQFHIQNDTGIIADLNSNYRQITLFDIGISAMPYASFKNRRFELVLGSGIGIASFEKFNETIHQKKQGANLRREIMYKTLFSPAITSHSQAEISYAFINKGNFSLGIIANADCLMTYRKIAYNRTIFTWTNENYIDSEIHPDRKFYGKYDVSLGLYIRF